MLFALGLSLSRFSVKKTFGSTRPPPFFPAVIAVNIIILYYRVRWFPSGADIVDDSIETRSRKPRKTVRFLRAIAISVTFRLVDIDVVELEKKKSKRTIWCFVLFSRFIQFIIFFSVKRLVKTKNDFTGNMSSYFLVPSNPTTCISEFWVFTIKYYFMIFKKTIEIVWRKRINDLNSEIIAV